MPRFHDYTKTNSYVEVTIDQPRYGAGELTVEDIRAGDELVFMARNLQFTTTWKSPMETFQKEMDQVFDWLSENTTGPWFWHEGWTNNYHTLHLGLHIERTCDQVLFQKTWGHAFEYIPDSDHDLEKLAVVRNVLPADPALFQWLGKHKMRSDANYFEPGTEGEEGRRVLVAADTPEKMELFQKHWGHIFKPFIPVTPHKSNLEGQIFIGSIPRNAKRSVPEDFRDYLEGRCDFAVVKTIPQPNDPNMRLPEPELACK